MKYEILVSLKGDVLDTEGRAICNTLRQLGYESLNQVKVSRKFVLEFEGDTDLKQIEKLARDVLANPVSQNVEVRPLP